MIKNDKKNQSGNTHGSKILLKKENNILMGTSLLYFLLIIS